MDPKNLTPKEYNIGMLKRLFDWVISSKGLRWTGITFLLFAYFLVSWKFVQGDGVWFQIINASGSVLMITSSLMMKPKDWPVAVFNVFWILVALSAFAHMLHLF